MIKYIGNDIVDLSEPGVLEQFENERFVNRVLAESEKVALRQSSSPKRLLWYLWAAKEAAYKVMKKIDHSVVFAHRKFVVQITNPESLIQSKKIEGVLVYEQYRFKLEWTSEDEWIHCCSILGEPEEAGDSYVDSMVRKVTELNLTHSFSIEEEESIHSMQSRAVRILGKHLLHKNGVQEARIIRHALNKRFGPPTIHKDSLKLDTLDLSMSHDGRFVACSLIL